jgi:aminopeptidase N
MSAGLPKSGSAQVATPDSDYQPLQTLSLSDTLHAIHYTIFLDEINTSAKTIAARAKILLESKVDNLQIIKLELRSLTVDQVLVNDVAVGSFTHNNDLITIPLTQPMQTGDQATVEVHYHGAPFYSSWGGYHFDGAYSFNLGVGISTDPHNLGKTWFPCIDDFHDRATYEVFATVPTDQMAIAGGLLLEVADNGNGTHTYHWSLSSAIPTYLASVATGAYSKVAYTFNSMSGDDIPVEIYVKPADTMKVAGTFSTLLQILAAYETYFGPYRWERVGYVGTAIGAMEHATSIALPHFCINGNLNYESLIAHELSHHWFGDLATCASAEDMWINEGWAVFCESMYREGLYGAAAYRSDMFARHKDVLHTAHIDDGGFLALYGIPSAQTYGTTVYQKGGLVVHTLRNYMGDSLFFPAVENYLETYAFDDIDSWELRDVLSASSGMDLTDFFDTWVFTPGFPEYSVDSFQVVPDGNDYQATVFAKQEHRGPGSVGNSVRVEVTFVDAQRRMETRLMEFSGETGQQTFTIPISPKTVLADFYDKVADATTDKSLTASAPFSQSHSDLFCKIGISEIAPGDTAFIRMTHRWVAPDEPKNPVNGIMISNTHHWRIDAVAAEGTKLTGSFIYNKFNHLDNELLSDPNDSLGVMYRANRATDWEPVFAVKTGSTNVGFFDLPLLLPGEYTLAAWDDMYVGMEEEIIEKQKTEITIFPNPAEDIIFITLGKRNATTVEVFDAKGQLTDTIYNFQRLNNLQYDTRSLSPGSYFLKFLDHNGREIENHKLIVN